jgi:hypothetical protein
MEQKPCDVTLEAVPPPALPMVSTWPTQVSMKLYFTDGTATKESNLATPDNQQAEGRGD